MVALIQNKTVSRKVAIALAALCIVTIIGLNISIITYWSDINSRNDTIQFQENQITDLQNQLNATQQQLSGLNTSRLIAIGLQYADNRSTPETPYATVHGYVVNVGTTKAASCRIHVTATQNNNSTAIDAAAELGPLDPGAWISINQHFTYEGAALQTINAFVEWTP